MGVGQTRLISGKLAINILVEEYDRKKRAKHFRNWNYTKQPKAICSQCKRGMKKWIAEAQIKNKREDAPICTACIVGIKRKDYEEESKN